LKQITGQYFFLIEQFPAANVKLLTEVAALAALLLICALN
jgi:hypothetical protein